jgi:hemin uptake protein HemP
MSKDRRPGAPEPPRGAAGETEPPRRIRRLRANELLGEERTIEIEHRGEVYTLRITRNERLILTK